MASARRCRPVVGPAAGVDEEAGAADGRAATRGGDRQRRADRGHGGPPLRHLRLTTLPPLFPPRLKPGVLFLAPVRVQAGRFRQRALAVGENV